MNSTRCKLSDLYLAALRNCLTEDTETNLSSATKLGRKALRLGVSIPDLSLVHEEALAALLSSAKTAEVYVKNIRQSGVFFRQALAPFLTVSPEKLQINAIVSDLAILKKQLQYETAKRKTAEISRQKSHQQYLRLQADSKVVQKQLRNLSHDFLRTQEEERKRISRELHDEISQILTGINVRLAALKIEAASNTGNVTRKITNAQRLVEKSVAAVHQFARDLRPAMLDDLGLVPALTTYMKEIRKRTGLQIRFSASKAVTMEMLDNSKRTVLYRIVQEALINVAKHAQATRVNVCLKMDANGISLEVNDDGKSFSVSKALANKHCKHLGLIGMRERAEMVGGTFDIESIPGKGTAIRVGIP
ncbi:MAG: histidine kinase, partial [Lentisphaeria bacterium]